MPLTHRDSRLTGGLLRLLSFAACTHQYDSSVLEGVANVADPLRLGVRGGHGAAAQAFQRLHKVVQVPRSGPLALWGQTDDAHRPIAEKCTKLNALASSLMELRCAEPDMRAVIFTNFK